MADQKLHHTNAATSASLTQEEIAERIAAATAKRPPQPKIDNTALLAETGLRVVHVETLEGRITVAYRPPQSKVLEIATSLCRRGDTFSRKVGTKLAVEHFLAGRTIFVPRGNYQPVHLIQDMFQGPALVTAIAESQAQ